MGVPWEVLRDEPPVTKKNVPCTWAFQIRIMVPHLQIHGLVLRGKHHEDHALELYEARTISDTRRKAGIAT
jgi:hypothetical protein